jgi:hypothetical protein
LSALDTPELFLETFVFNNTETGNIISRSSTTNENGNYTITIEPTNQSVPLLRETALQQQKDGNLIPLEIQFPLETS